MADNNQNGGMYHIHNQIQIVQSKYTLFTSSGNMFTLTATWKLSKGYRYLITAYLTQASGGWMVTSHVGQGT